MSLIHRSWLKSLSGLFINFSALWFGIILTTPIFLESDTTETAIRLTKNIGFGIVYLLLAVEAERILEDDF